MIELEDRNQVHMYAYDRLNGNKCLLIQGMSESMRGNYTITIDTYLTRDQTVVLTQGENWEIVVELRPRKYTQSELAKLRKP